jgi:hypothetical protein
MVSISKYSDKKAVIYRCYFYDTKDALPENSIWIHPGFSQ